MIRRGPAAADLMNTVEASSFTIRYRSELLHALAHEALEAYLSFPSGEIAGVLFGWRRGGEIRIQAARPVACEFAKGPADEHPAGDEEPLRKVLEVAARDDSLRGLSPVGYYVSRTRLPSSVRDSGATVFLGRFGEASGVALVLKPLASGEVRAGFFESRGVGPAAHSQCVHEFSVLPAPPSPPLASGSSASRPPADVLAAGKATRLRRLLWLVPPIGLVLGGGWMLREWYLGPPRAPLQLRIEAERNGQLVLRWEPQSKFIQEAQRAELQIVTKDGEFLSAIQPEALRSGSLPLTSPSGDIRARLRVYPALPGRGEEPVEEATRYLAPSIASNSAGIGPPDAQPRFPEDDERPAAARIEEPPPPKRESPPAARETLGAVQPAPVAPTPAPPSEAEVPRRPLFSDSGPATARPDPAESFPQPAAPPAGLSYNASAARSGRVIWSGYLPATGTLTIDRGSVSIGSLAGALPGRPVRIRAYPAELSSAGMTVYHGDEAEARDNAVEAPGPRNAWTRTQFVRDPSRASNLSVVEAPSPANGWAMVRLRCGLHPVSVVIIEWYAID
jgi:hypothetical protein